MSSAGASNRLLNAGLALGSVAATLLMLELGLRLTSGDPLAPPAPRLAESGLELLDSAYPARFDARLGHVPRAGAAGHANVWGTEVTIDAGGLRSNGGPNPGGDPILVVGDSFTFGDEVNDDETWPAQLERRIGRRVVNGGVFGYGLDQIVLRAEQLLETIDTNLMLVAFIGDSVVRCEYAYRYGWKPYFALAPGGLQLRNVPVPEPSAPLPAGHLTTRVMRGSHLAYFLGARIDPDRWLTPDSLRVHRQGTEVAVRLVDRLSDAARERGVTVIWLLLWHPGADNEPALPVIKRAQALGDGAITVGTQLREQMPERADGKGRDPSRFFHVLPSGRTGHLSIEGNAAVAERVADILVANQLVRESPDASPIGDDRPVE